MQMIVERLINMIRRRPDEMNDTSAISVYNGFILGTAVKDGLSTGPSHTGPVGRFLG